LPDPSLSPFTRTDFDTGVALNEYAAELAAVQPDFQKLLAETELAKDAVARFRGSGARYAALITETWCLDSLHAIPILVRLQDAAPDIQVRTWKRSESGELALRIAGEPPGGKLPGVPHIAFYDTAFAPLGQFRERPSSISAWLDEESRHFRTRLRMQERARVRAETLDGLLMAAEKRPVAATSTAGRPLAVYEYWEARSPELRGALVEALRRHQPRLQQVPGVLSVDFAEVMTTPGRYLALFRYVDASVRPTFLASPSVRDMRAEVNALWVRVSETVWHYGL
jgi:hypothetical protein